MIITKLILAQQYGQHLIIYCTPYYNEYVATINNVKMDKTWLGLQKQGMWAHNFAYLSIFLNS